ncbi:NnrS family protein, partial [Craterilacuibacter sp.]|uniref:NnrS family protein n=1 Tax=Craterilacuibacter sp. TaxID=2870909 RepID=UPI003F4017FE
MLEKFYRTTMAPHRLGFLAGGILLLVSLVWWGAQMVGRFGGSPMLSAVPALFLHGYSMVYSFFPLFMLGFIYTAGPRWLGVASPSRKCYAPVLLGYAAGGVLVLLASYNTQWLTPGIALQALAWTGALAIWLRAVHHSKASDKTHARLVALAFGAGWLGLLLGFYWAISSNTYAWLAVVDIGIWGLLLPVFLTVSHRMLPFFSASALTLYQPWRPKWLLGSWIALSFSHGALEIFSLNTLLPDLAFAALLLYTSYRWRLLASFKVKLLAMLHASFVWAGIALSLYAVSSALQLAGHAGLGFAPLHALALGFFSTMLLAFVTRVTLGHSGRPLVAGILPWTCYWLMHGVAIARVAGEI